MSSASFLVVVRDDRDSIYILIYTRYAITTTPPGSAIVLLPNHGTVPSYILRRARRAISSCGSSPAGGDERGGEGGAGSLPRATLARAGRGAATPVACRCSRGGGPRAGAGAGAASSRSARVSAAAFSASVTTASSAGVTAAAPATTMASAEFVDDVDVRELDRQGVADLRGRGFAFLMGRGGSGRVRAAEGRREREAGEEELQEHAGAA